MEGASADIDNVTYVEDAEAGFDNEEEEEDVDMDGLIVLLVLVDFIVGRCIWSVPIPPEE